MYVPGNDGSFQSEAHFRVAELIHEYDPSLSVRYIPADKREAGDPPFCIVERTRSGKEVVAFYCMDLNEDILQRVYAADNTKQNVLTALEAKNLAVRNLQKRQLEDERAERNEIAAAILKSPKSSYKHNGVVYQ